MQDLSMTSWPDHLPSGNQKRFASEAAKTHGTPQPLSPLTLEGLPDAEIRGQGAGIGLSERNSDPERPI